MFNASVCCLNAFHFEAIMNHSHYFLCCELFSFCGLFVRQTSVSCSQCVLDAFEQLVNVMRERAGFNMPGFAFVVKTTPK